MRQEARNSSWRWARLPISDGLALMLTISSGARTQAQAGARALKLCNDNDGARDADGVCYLYAIGDDVVLSRRLTAPIGDK